MASDIQVRDDPDERRYEILVGGELAGLAAYRDAGHHRSFIHTEIEPGFAHQGLATRLIAGALADTRAAGRQVLPFCPFVRSYIAEHPEELDLVPADARAGFELPDNLAAPGAPEPASAQLTSGESSDADG